jgi:undecaprenol kinase
MTQFSYKRLFKSFYYAFRGLARFVQTEQNAKVHLTASILVGICAYAFHIPRVEVAVLFLAVVLVFAIEIINTAIEKLLDIVHPENHSQIAYIKDALAGAVLIAAMIAVGVGFFIFYPYIRDIWM